MGCDIHMVLERKANGKWIGVDTYQGHESALGKGYAWPEATNRNYRRFAALAGVRGDGPEPKGMPDDASDTAKILSEHWGSDGHSHSWFPLAEAAAIFLATAHQPNDFAQKYPEAHFFGCDLENPEEYRLVFWFDN